MRKAPALKAFQWNNLCKSETIFLRSWKMTNLRMAVCWVMIVVSFVVMQCAHADVVFDNGQVNELNWSTSEYIYVRNNFFNQPTTLNITGGTHTSPFTGTYFMYVEETSHVSMYDGVFESGALYIGDNATFDMLGGTINYSVYGKGEGCVSIFSGIVDHMYGEDNAELLIEGGQVGYFLASYNSNVEISGGTIDEFWVHQYATADVTGGQFGILKASGSTDLVLYGSEFQIDGIDVEYKTYYTNDKVVDAVLTGVLSNGDILNNVKLEMYSYSSITFVNPVPEPTTLLLLGMGGLLIRKRK